MKKQRRSRKSASAPPEAFAGAAALRKAFEYREHQRKARDAFKAGKRRQFLAWHRRAGKDAFCLQLAAEEMGLIDGVPGRIGSYWHLYPLHAHARRALWNGVDPETGVRFIDLYFPEHLREYVNDQEMFIRFRNGSTWQLLGSDHYNRLVGAGTVGISVSEWALCDPRFYDYVRPIIRENNGWIIFITTFRGRNHAWQMYKQLGANPDWYVDLATVLDTKRQDGSPIVTAADIQKDRDEGMTEALVQQEYFCNPAASLPGSVYGASIERMREASRIGSFAFDAGLPVQCAWALEFAPVNIAAVFLQPCGNEYRAIASRSWPFTELADCIAEVRSGYPWRVGEHILPPDDSGIYPGLFEDLGIYAQQAPRLDVSRRAMSAQAFLSRLSVDNVARPFERVCDANNDLLIDSINGFRLKEAGEGSEFTLTVFQSFEQYLARAVEHFAAWERTNGLRPWGREPNYSQSDRAVI